MVTISNVDLVMAALRSRLQRIAAEKRTDKTRTTRASGLARNNRRDRVEALEAMRQLPDEEFDRALVRAMLEIELGEAVAADSRFQQVVDYTARVLRENPEMQGIFRQIQAGKD